MQPKGPTKGLKNPRYEYLVDSDRLNLSRASDMMSILSAHPDRLSPNQGTTHIMRRHASVLH